MEKLSLNKSMIEKSNNEYDDANMSIMILNRKKKPSIQKPAKKSDEVLDKNKNISKAMAESINSIKDSYKQITFQVNELDSNFENQLEKQQNQFFLAYQVN